MKNSVRIQGEQYRKLGSGKIKLTTVAFNFILFVWPIYVGQGLQIYNFFVSVQTFQLVLNWTQPRVPQFRGKGKNKIRNVKS